MLGRNTVEVEKRFAAAVGEMEGIHHRVILDRISDLRGEGSIVPVFELPSNPSAWHLSGVDSRLADLLGENNENGTVEVTVFFDEVRIFNPSTLRSLFVSHVRPFLRIDGLVSTSSTDEATRSFIDNCASDTFQDRTSRFYQIKEEQFAAYKNAYSILKHISGFLHKNLADQLSKQLG